MSFSDSFLDEIKSRSDIVTIIKDYVSLKQRGHNHVACCPFHKEKTPSFTVQPDKEMFYCYGCNLGGNVFTFIQKIENLSFPEAVKFLADNAGISLPTEIHTAKQIKQVKERDKILEMNKLALGLWKEELKKNASARAYLTNRGIIDDTIKELDICYAPDNMDSLTSFLKSKKYTDEEILKSGLVTQSNTTLFDKFRDRIITPIFDIRGNILAFSGRVLTDQLPKYINSPETVVYTKGDHLYGLNIVKETIKKRGFALLVEGNFDFVSLYQFGIKNAVAGLGTAFTDGQARLLKRVSDKIVVCYDGDASGRQSSAKTIKVLLATGFDIKIMLLPDNTDADDFVRTFGAKEFERLRSKSTGWLEFLLNVVKTTFNLKLPKHKAKAVSSILGYIEKIGDAVERRAYFDTAMDAFNVDDSLRNSLWLSIKDKYVVEKIVISTEVTISPAEKRLLELWVEVPEVRSETITYLLGKDYEKLETAEIFRKLIELDEEDTLTSVKLMDQLSDKSKGILSHLLISIEKHSYNDKEQLTEEAKSCLLELRELRKQHDQEQLLQKIQILETDNKFDEAKELSKQVMATSNEQCIL